MNPLRALQDFGQSIWLDDFRRSLVTSGGLQALIAEDGLSGITSNPSTFEKAIGRSTDYDDALKAMAQERDLDADALYERLAVEDITMAADMLRPVYDATRRRDGFMLRPVLIATAVAGAWAIPLALGGLAEARGDDAAASKSDLRPALQPGALLGQLGELFRLPGFDRNIHANAVSMLPRAETSSALTPSVMRISGAAA